MAQMKKYSTNVERNFEKSTPESARQPYQNKNAAGEISRGRFAISRCSYSDIPNKNVKGSGKLDFGGTLKVRGK